jgi:hypothetical protein
MNTPGERGILKVTKELHLAAPRPKVSVYAWGQCYTAASGTELIETVRLEARNPKPGSNTFAYYTPEAYQRLSKDNGRTWRSIGSPYREEDPSRPGVYEYPPHFYLDPDNGALVKFILTYEHRPEWNHVESFSDAGTYGRSQRLFYQVSHDRARTWEPLRQVIARGDGFDSAHWGPGLYFGRTGGQYGVGPILKSADGSILHAIVVNLFDGNRYQSGFIRGRWTTAGDALDWEFSSLIRMTDKQSSQGCCEPAPALMADGRIFVSLRCCGDRQGRTFPSLKYWVLSEDGGRTFSEPRPLTYEDGAPVWSPSSMAAVWRAPANGRHYWIGNILDAPTYDAYPRYPLCAAELLPERGMLVRASVTVLDTKPADLAEPRRRYTNFGMYEDRETRELVLTMPEQPRTDWADFTADCYRYRLNVDESSSATAR